MNENAEMRQTHLNHVSNWCFAYHIPSEVLSFAFFLWFYEVKVLETHLAYSSSFRARLWCSQDLLLLSGVELHFIVAAIKGALVRLAALSGRKLPTMDLQPAVRPPFLFKKQFSDAMIWTWSPFIPSSLMPVLFCFLSVRYIWRGLTPSPFIMQPLGLKPASHIYYQSLQWVFVKPTGSLQCKEILNKCTLTS